MSNSETAILARIEGDLAKIVACLEILAKAAMAQNPEAFKKPPYRP
jgi:hypothetical protein